MENYVIRIYRRDKTDPRQIVGLVIEPETGTEQRFGSIDELIEALLKPLDNAEKNATSKI